MPDMFSSCCALLQVCQCHWSDLGFSPGATWQAPCGGSISSMAVPLDGVCAGNWICSRSMQHQTRFLKTTDSTQLCYAILHKASRNKHNDAVSTLHLRTLRMTLRTDKICVSSPCHCAPSVAWLNQLEWVLHKLVTASCAHFARGNERNTCCSQEHHGASWDL